MIIPKDVLDEIKGFVEIREIKNARIVNVQNRELYKKLRKSLGKGEAAVICIALETGGIAILDDLKARKIAKKMGVKIMGTLSLLLEAKRRGKIKNIKDVLDKLISENFRISKELYYKALDLANESSSSNSSEG